MILFTVMTFWSLQILDPDLMKVLDTVEKEIEADAKRFGARVSDDEVASKRKKRYVFLIIFKTC